MTSAYGTGVNFRPSGLHGIRQVLVFRSGHKGNHHVVVSFVAATTGTWQHSAGCVAMDGSGRVSGELGLVTPREWVTITLEILWM